MCVAIGWASACFDTGGGSTLGGGWTTLGDGARESGLAAGDVRGSTLRGCTGALTDGWGGEAIGGTMKLFSVRVEALRQLEKMSLACWIVWS